MTMPLRLLSLVYPGQGPIIATPEGIPAARPWPQGEEEPVSPLPDGPPHGAAPPEPDYATYGEHAPAVAAYPEVLLRLLSQRPHPWNKLPESEYDRHAADLRALPLEKHLRLLQHLHERLPNGSRDHAPWRLAAGAFGGREPGPHVPIDRTNWSRMWYLHEPPKIEHPRDGWEERQRQIRRFADFVRPLPGGYRYAFTPDGVDLEQLLDRDINLPRLAEKLKSPPSRDGMTWSGSSWVDMTKR
jgi:hypothetical protein